jgi:uncharacterized membrane protein YidH (DUF202 family)
MKRTVKNVLLCILPGLMSALGSAQDTAARQAVPMADGLRASGKIYVVVAVLLTILAGIFLYLIMLDKKISRLEKQATGH